MRKLTAGLTINEDTFAPDLVLLLDGVRTNTVFAVETAADIKALHGSEGEQAFIDSVLELLSVYEALTDEEMQYYKANFRDLIKEDRVQL